jgi:ABC-2 type transport system permease protein/lipopolysaccharide transport system permease protein
MGVTVAALGFLYGGLFKRPLDKYLPYLAAGFVVWGLLSGLVLDGSRCFVGREGLIRQLAAPLSIYVFETLWMNLLIFSHNLVIFGIVSIIFQNEPNLAWLLFLPGILVVLINGVWIALFCGVISARFRDFPQVLASLVQVMFFVTPIIWNPDMLPGRALLLDLNPFYHLLEVVRAPMLGKSPSVDTWIAIALITVAGWTSALTVYSLYRRRLAYWV